MSAFLEQSHLDKYVRSPPKCKTGVDMPKKVPWSYKPFEPLDLPSGKYQIWIFAADRLGKAHTAGKSGCAWEIRDEQNNAIESPAPLKTDQPHSTQWRGWIAAATRGVERVPNGSVAIICSHHTGFLKSIEALDTNAENGWKKKDGKTYDGVDIWERLLLARDGEEGAPRHVNLKTREASTALDDEIISRLKEKVARALDGPTPQKKKPKAK